MSTTFQNSSAYANAILVNIVIDVVPQAQAVHVPNLNGAARRVVVAAHEQYLPIRAEGYTANRSGWARNLTHDFVTSKRVDNDLVCVVLADYH